MGERVGNGGCMSYEVYQVVEGDRMGGQEDGYRSMGRRTNEAEARLLYKYLSERHPRDSSWVRLELHQVLEVQPMPVVPVVPAK